MPGKASGDHEAADHEKQADAGAECRPARVDKAGQRRKETAVHRHAVDMDQEDTERGKAAQAL